MLTLWTLKIVLTPILIGLITLAARKWGPGIGGTLAGLPLTSGPVSVFLALEQGDAFAAHAASSTLLGLIGVAIFCAVYALCSLRFSWPVCVLIATCALIFQNVLTIRLQPALALSFVCVLGAILIARIGIVAMVRREARDQIPERAFPKWDIVLRMVITALVVGLLTAAAARLGPQLTGLISPWPVVVCIVGAFVHAHAGGTAARLVLKGALTGSIAFATFFVIVAGTITSLGKAGCYLLATAGALLLATAFQKSRLNAG